MDKASPPIGGRRMNELMSCCCSFGCNVRFSAPFSLVRWNVTDALLFFLISQTGADQRSELNS